MSDADALLEELKNSSSIGEIAENEGENNLDVEDAHNKELIDQSKNRTKFGRFAIDWVMSMVAIVSIFLILMMAFYVWEVIHNQDKLEVFLATVYSELKLFFQTYQTVLVVVATLIFGDKLKNKNKSDK